jgi:hypothetical protein
MQVEVLRVSVMFVVSSTTYGISQRLQAYTQMSDAMARAAVAPGTPSDRSFIFQVSSVDDRPSAVSTVGMGGGVFVDSIKQTSHDRLGGNAATAMIVTALSAELQTQGAAAPDIGQADPRAASQTSSPSMEKAASQAMARAMIEAVSASPQSLARST